MKKIILLLSALLSFSMFADNPEEYHIKGILADGTEIEGYNATSFSNHWRPWVSDVEISETYKGEKKKYSSDELKAIWFTMIPKDSVPVIFHSIKAQKRMPNLLSKNPKPYKKPVFMRLIYNGENVKGYALPIVDRTAVPSMTIDNYTWRYYYLTKDSDVAVAYWDDVDGIIPSMRKVMKFYFRAFPELVRMVDSGEIKPTDFRSNPTSILPLMDKYYNIK